MNLKNIISDFNDLMAYTTRSKFRTADRVCRVSMLYTRRSTKIH